MRAIYCILGAGAMISVVHLMNGLTEPQFWGGWFIVSLIYYLVDKVTE